jgi:RNA polymerase sigma-70 factor (TIGR02960 family)
LLVRTVTQETLMAAWRGLDGSGERTALRAWLSRIKTRKWRDVLRRGRTDRPPAMERQEFPVPELLGPADTPWLEPYPDGLLGDPTEGTRVPGARYEARESISLAFVAALQHLPPRERAVLVLCDVLGFGAEEAAEILDSGADAVNDALSGAREGITARLPSGWHDRSPRPDSAREREVAGRFAAAFERGDPDGMVALLTDDAWLAMPPLPFGYRGRAAAEFLSSAACRGGTRRFRLIATRANGQPAFGCYLSDPAAPVCHAHGLIVLTLDGDRVSGITRFLDNSVLSRFGLPRTLPDETEEPGPASGYGPGHG